MTREIVYYDHDFRKECARFCNSRRIKVLPDIRSRDTCYKFENGQFKREPIHEDQFVQAHTHIFQPGLAARFNTYNILFVREEEELVGVVHFCDYNHPRVYEACYQKLYQLERGALRLAEQGNELTEQDLAKFLKGKNTREGTSRPLKVYHFHQRSTSLKDILEFVQHHRGLKFKNLKKIHEVRNRIAHSLSIVRKHNPDQGSRNYDMAAFDKFMVGMEALLLAHRQVNNRLYFNLAKEQGNFNIDVNTVRQTLHY